MRRRTMARAASFSRNPLPQLAVHPLGTHQDGRGLLHPHRPVELLPVGVILVRAGPVDRADHLPHLLGVRVGVVEKPRLPLEAVDGAEGVEEGLLHRVSGVLFVAQQAACHREQTTAVRSQQLLVGAILAPSQASQNGWNSGAAIGGVVLAVVSLGLFVFQQRRATSPFIPAEFRRNTRFIALVTMSFLLMAANAGFLIGLPILLAIFNATSVLTIGLVMLPGAVLSAISGVAAGRFIDRFGAPTLMRFGGAIMLIGIVGLSAEAGGRLWLIAAFGSASLLSRFVHVLGEGVRGLFEFGKRAFNGGDVLALGCFVHFFEREPVTDLLL